MNSVYRAQSRKLTGPLRRLAWRSGLAVQLWASGEENPFSLRDRRLDARRHKPRRTLVAVTALILLFNVISWGLGYAYGPLWQRSAWLAARNAQGPDDLIGWTTLQFLTARPLFLAATIACAVCAYATFWVAQSRAAAQLKAESLKGTLEQLQLLPLAEERWLWLMSAQPAATGLLIGGLGVPLYLLAVLTGQWSVWDVLGLGLVFVWLTNRVPVWNPSRRTTAKTRAQGPKPSQPQPGAAAEASRAEAAASDEPSVNATSLQLSFLDPAWLITGLLVRQGLMEMFRFAQTGAPRGSSNGFWSHLFWSLSAGSRMLLPAFPLTWPLLLARGLMTPLPFFALALPPFVLLLPYGIGVRVNRYSVLATQVSINNHFWQQRRARRRQAMGRLLWWCAGLMAVGYGWRPLILGGRLSAMLEAPHTLAWALAAGWTLALVLGTSVAAQSITKAFAVVDGSAPYLPTAWRLARRGIASGLGSAIGLYFVACWLGGCAGVSAPWLARLVPTGVTVAAFLLALSGSFALGAVLPAELRQPWRWLHYLWFYGLPCEAFIRVVREWIRPTSDGVIQNFSFEQAPHLVLSPTVSLLALFRSDLARPGLPWWLGPGFQIGVGSICLLACLRTAPIHAASGALPVESSWWARCEAALWELWRAARRQVLALALWLWRRLSPWWLRCWIRFAARIEACAQYLLHWAELLDNPLITLQFRRGARLWVGVWLTLAGAGVITLLLLGRPWELISMSRQPQGVAPNFLLLPQNMNWQTWGMLAVASCLSLAGVAVTLAVIGLGQAFDTERHAGTLVFLFLTALTDDELLIGKLLPRLMFGAGMIAAALPCLSVGCLVAGCGGDWSWVLISVLGLMAIASTLVFVACWQLLFATRAKIPLEGMLKGLVSLFCIETVGWICVITGACASIAYLSAALLVVALSHAALSVLSWRLAGAALRRQRYGDIALTGKVRIN